MNLYFLFLIDVLLFPYEVWVLRGTVFLESVTIMIMIAVAIYQYRKMSGLVLLDFNRKRNARRRRRNLQTTRL